MPVSTTVSRLGLWAGVVLLLASWGAALLLWHHGTRLTSPIPSRVGAPPPELALESVQFSGRPGISLRGWYIPGLEDAPVLVLLHGRGGNRTSMLGRGRFLSEAGYSVLLFDFQAHGESSGTRYTFGHLEAIDAKAALAFARQRNPRVKIGAIGFSLGAAACVLGPEPAQFDALVLEALYPTIEEAIGNRIAMRLGAWAAPLHPLLGWQLKPRLGIAPSMLRPIDRIAAINKPVLLIAGGEDAHVTLEQSRRLFASATAPKQFWSLATAGHEDYHRFARKDYERIVLAFLAEHLQSPSATRHDDMQ